mgnify:FL=1
MSKFFKNISFYILLFIVIAFLFTMLNTGSDLEVSFTDFVQYLKNGEISEMYVEDQLVRAKLSKPETREGKEYKEIVVSIDSVDILYQHVGDTIKDQVASGDLKLTMVPPQSMPIWLSILPTIIIVIIFIVFWFFFMQQSQGGGGKMMSFGKSRAKAQIDPNNKKMFEDVAGAEEEKEELREIVDFLKNPKKYIELGARIPKGVLLVGPPGTGKTLLAKAVAGEANAPFFSISGSDFVEMFVGVGASRVRDLFEQAKKNQPSIIFIDEIDAVGRHRGAGLGGGHDEREQTLNQLLVEMDGFGANEGIIVLAATNRADILDPALMRPGRFDRQVYVGYPDQKARLAILKVHSKNKPLSKDVDLSVIAKTTYGFTGADLENLLNEAALLAAREDLTEITPHHLDDAMLKVVMGPEKKSREVQEKDKKQTAYHEAGHAVASKNLETQDKVHQVSIIPRGRAGGFTMSLPDHDKAYISKREMIEDIVTMMGGRVAEEMIFGEINTGASSDIQRATKVATEMVTKYGMSDKLGSRTFGSNEEIFIGRDYGHAQEYSDATAALIDEEIDKIIADAYKQCQELLKAHRDELEAVAQALIEKEVLTGEEFDAVIKSVHEDGSEASVQEESAERQDNE